MFERGNQIAYIPNHAEGDIRHEDVELGFVTCALYDKVFCRFWSRSNPDELRTKANSEGCYAGNLVLYHSRPQEVVDRTLTEIDKADISGGVKDEPTQGCNAG